MLFVDLDLARRLEAVEAWVTAEYGRARLEIKPGADTAVVSVAGGYACFLGEGSPLTEAKGLGMAGPVSDDELEVMERVFFDRAVPAKIMVCPLADPSLLEGLGRRGYRAVGFEDVLYRSLDQSATFPVAQSGFVLNWAGTDDVETCGQTLARGFVAPEEPGPEMLEIFAMSARVKGTTALLARVEGEPAAAASLLVHDGLAMLAGAATLPIFRNRGIQTAMSHTRLAFAVSSGCDVAVIGALPGSTSHRNAERLGFRVAYTKVAFHRDPH